MEIEIEGESKIACMGMLLSMKACANIVAQGNNKETAELDLLIAQNPNLTPQLSLLRQKLVDNNIRRVEGHFVHHLVDAAYLEVNDIPSAEFARYLRDSCGWTGTACYNENLDLNLRDDIRNALGFVPYRVKRIMEDGKIILVPPPPPVQEQPHP